jgi:dTDP-4-dehydrorhamnose 3,5-epimerase
VISELADVVYMQSGYYDPALERAIAYDDPDIGIEWPVLDTLTVSQRDRAAPRLAEVAEGLGFAYTPRSV